jgi:hypothetical protein
VRITRDDFKHKASSLHGLRVSHAWRGFGSAIFLELGALTKVSRVTRDGFYLKGQATVMIEWSWRIESRRAVLAGSFSTESKITRAVATLAERVLASVELCDFLPEVRLTFDDGHALQSFMTAEGQPAWTLFLPDRSNLHVSRGSLQWEAPKGARSTRSVPGVDRAQRRGRAISR